jgi:hypothetical protein
MKEECLPMLPDVLYGPLIFRVSCDFMTIHQDLIPEAISSQKYHVNIVRFSTVTELWMFEIQDDSNLT